MRSTYPWLCISPVFQIVSEENVRRVRSSWCPPRYCRSLWLSSSLYAQVTSAFVDIFGGRLISRTLLHERFREDDQDDMISVFRFLTPRMESMADLFCFFYVGLSGQENRMHLIAFTGILIRFCLLVLATSIHDRSIRLFYP